MSRLGFVGTALVLLVGANPLDAQSSLRAKVEVDPYTKGDAAAMQKAGYESFGPFPLGVGHDTRAASELLGTEPLLWIETAHFRLGCSLSRTTVRGDEAWGAEWMDSVRGELKQLAKRLPRVKADTKELDPWLRAHLMAQRLEGLYARMLEDLGANEVSHSTEAGGPSDATTLRGFDNHFGMREKFTVLLVQKAGSHARYTRAYQGNEVAEPVRWHDAKFGSLYFGASEEAGNGLFRHDYAIHAHVMFNVAHNLVSGYRGYSHDLPPWLVTGLAHWHSRAVTPRFPAFDRRDNKDKEPRGTFWQWDRRVRGLVDNQAFEPVPALLVRTSAGAFDLEQHMQSWALVDYLMATDKAKLMQFLHRMKDPFHSGHRLPSNEEIGQRQDALLQEIFGWDATALEAAWRKQVLATKQKK